MTSTDFTAPMELIGGRSGVSVIDASSILKRLWYFDGRFLRASGFRLDQEYVRSLVALSNQALGHGVVQGLDVDLAGGDQLRVEAGLALAPSGRVVYLPQDVDVSIAQLIARSSGDLDPGAAASPGVADFSPCPPDEPADPALPVPPRPLYVLTVAGAEALCGEEERFGQLCEDACATESDRSVAVEGVVFRVRELSLSLPTSRTVPFTGRHLRSRVASAWFARERATVPSMISGAGLRTPVWCDGADGVGGEELPLAVFDRSGSVTSLLDNWTARRELVETTPQRYWAARMAMRPWDVFLAQVLQFQCQLLDLGGDDGVGTVDPCDTEHEALAAANEILSGLSETLAPHEAPVHEAAVHEAAVHESPAHGGLATPEGLVAPEAPGTTRLIAPELLGRIEDVRSRIVDSLAGARRSATGSLLLDGGIVELPSGGYLPVSAQRDVRAQVSALLGPGVDLRFCAVRPDFIPEALQEAQHMDRISLTQGIDDPGELEEVDVLVPGGSVTETPAAESRAFAGAVRILPSKQVENLRVTTGSALTLSAVARDQVTDGWSWSLAGYGEAPQQVSVPDVVEGLLGFFRAGHRSATGPLAEAGHSEEAAAEAAEAVLAQPVAAEDVHAEGAHAAESMATIELMIRSDAEHDAHRRGMPMLLRANREAALSGERRAMAEPVMMELATPTLERIPPDRPIDPHDARPVALWFDIDTDEGLDDLAVGARTNARLRLSAYSRARTSPVLIDVRVTGSLVVSQRIGPSVSGTGVTRIVTTLEGFVDPLIGVGTREIDPEMAPVDGLELEWEVEVSATGVRILRVTVGDDSRRGTAYAADAGTPRRVTGHLDLAAAGTPVSTGAWDGITHLSSGQQQLRRLLAFELDESPGALDSGAPDRDLADAALVLIGTELALPGRDPQFTTFARARLFGGAPSGPVREIRSSSDWVMFHRRRVALCSDVLSEPPTQLRRYRWHHAVVSDRAELESLRALWGTWVQPGSEARDIDFLRVRQPVDGLGFEPVATLEFEADASDLQSSLPALHTSWTAAERGDRLAIGLVGDIGAGDGETLALARLASARSAVSHLIDTSRMRVSTLADVPAEFRGTGIDGVILTVGQQRAPVATECARLLRMSRDDLARLEDALQGRDELSITLLGEIMAEMGIDVDEVTAVFEEDRLTNPEALMVWWNGSSALRAAALLSDAVLQSDADLARWDARLSVLQTQLQLSNLAASKDPWEMADCPAVILIAAREVPQ